MKKIIGTAVKLFLLLSYSVVICLGVLGINNSKMLSKLHGIMD